MTIKKIIIFLSLLSFSCSREYIKPLNVKRNFSGSLWIVRHEISTPEKIDALLNSIKGTDINNLFVQIRGRGDSYYQSDLEFAAYDVPHGFDPLQYLLDKVKKSDIKIHAWINVSLVLSPGKYPPPAEHVLSKHPDWITYDYSGRSMAEYSPAELKKNLLEGYFLDPAVPEVKNYVNSIILDVLAKYRVAGIHLDFIRYPYSGYNDYFKKYMSDFGYNPYARKIFKKRYGTDPIRINRFKNTELKRAFDQFRRDQVTEIVAGVNRIVKDKDPALIVSAAVMPRFDRSRNVYFQDWPEWIKKGYIDLACIMSYTDEKSVFKNYLDYASRTEAPEQIFMGVSAGGRRSLVTAHEQIRMSYDKGFRGYIIFSFRHDKEYLEDLNSLINYEDSIYKN